MLVIRKSTQAETDLEDIWRYSFNKWSEQQADTYYDALIEGMESLAAHPKIGKARENIRPGLRSFHVERHIIYYRVETNHIMVLRVRHDATDPDLYED